MRQFGRHRFGTAVALYSSPVKTDRIVQSHTTPNQADVGVAFAQAVQRQLFTF